MLLNIEKYFILESKIRASDDFSPEKKERVNYNVAATGELYENSDDNSKCRIVISITFDRKKGTRKNSIPYSGFVKLVGFININDDIPYNKREDLLMVNGLSLLYGAAREHIASVTSRGPWEAFYLPTVSFRKDETSIDSELKKGA